MSDTLKLIPTTLLIMLIGGLILMVALPLMVRVPALKSIIDELPIPFSKHAMDGHADQKWNAETIQQHMQMRKCTPQEYICADSDRQIVWCAAEKGIPAIGLIIGRTFRQVITGFAGRNNYWQNRCQDVVP